MSQFQKDIQKFNGIYKLPIASTPTTSKVNGVVARLINFKDILSEEVKEIDDVIELAKDYAADPTNEKQLTVLTNLADLLGDIQVYCASEMAKFGLPLDEILSIIMQSNFSKLDENGNPIYDERNKVLKGPNYWKPEPKILELLKQKQTVISEGDKDVSSPGSVKVKIKIDEETGVYLRG